MRAASSAVPSTVAPLADQIALDWPFLPMAQSTRFPP